MKKYNSVEQRMIATYIETLPQITDSKRMCNNPKIEMYSFVKEYYYLILDNPSLLFTYCHEDDAFNNRFNKSSDNKPELLKQMKKACVEIEKMFDFLLSVFSSLSNNKMIPGNKLNKKYLTVLELLGIEFKIEDSIIKIKSLKYPGFENALFWLRENREQNKGKIARNIFHGEGFNRFFNYREFSGDSKQYDRLIQFLRNNNYFLVEGDEYPSLEYLKGKNGSMPERGGFQYKVNHIGISINYDEFVKEPTGYSICIPSMVKLISLFYEMEDGLKTFITTITKKCDNCRYCVQTDKTGKRKKAFISVEFQGKKYPLCPYFPGYYYTFTYLNEKLVDCMIKLLSFMDERMNVLIK